MHHANNNNSNDNDNDNNDYTSNNNSNNNSNSNNKKKLNQISKPNIMSTVVEPAAARVKTSESSRDLKGYLEPLTHLCTVLNIANESCIRIQEITLP